MENWTRLLFSRGKSLLLVKLEFINSLYMYKYSLDQT